MAVTSKLNVQVELSGDSELKDIFSNSDNASSPGVSTVVDLSSGDNTITVPTGGSSSPVALIILPPSGNTTAITLKGNAGDTGVALHKTNPSVIGFDGTPTIILNAGAAITGLRYLFI